MTHGLRVGSSGLALGAARAGLGIVLGQVALAAPLLHRGELVAPCPRSLPLGHAYCAVFSHAKQNNPALQTLLTLLQAPCAAEPRR